MRDSSNQLRKPAPDSRLAGFVMHDLGVELAFSKVHTRQILVCGLTMNCSERTVDAELGQNEAADRKSVV